MSWTLLVQLLILLIVGGAIVESVGKAFIKEWAKQTYEDEK